MAESKHANFRYKLIDKFLRSKNGITYKDLLNKVNEYLNTEFAIKSISMRQLEMDLNHIENFYEIEILKYPSINDKRIKILKYAVPDASIYQKPLNAEEVEILQSLLSDIQMLHGRPNSLNLYQIFEKLSKDVFLSDNNAPIVFYQGNEYLKGIQNFPSLNNWIRNHQRILVVYQGFQKSKIEIEISPYFLKEYNNRWYVFGYCHNNSDSNGIVDKVINLALDRIASVSESFNEFKPINFNPVEYFDDIYGVSQVDGAVESLVLNFYGLQGHYVETNPIHASQKGKWLDDKTYEVRLALKINYELVSKLLSYGAEVYVLAPIHLQLKLKEIAHNIENMYS
jgi:hypothetical protein